MKGNKYESIHDLFSYIVGYIVGLILIRLHFGEVWLEPFFIIHTMISMTLFVWLHTRMRTLYLKEDGIYTQLYYHDSPKLLVTYDDIEKLIVHREYGDIKRIVLHTTAYSSFCIRNDYRDFQSFVDYLSVTLNIPVQVKSVKS